MIGLEKDLQQERNFQGELFFVFIGIREIPQNTTLDCDETKKNFN